jgi:hypothetical protein
LHLNLRTLQDPKVVPAKKIHILNSDGINNQVSDSSNRMMLMFGQTSNEANTNMGGSIIGGAFGLKSN